MIKLIFLKEPMLVKPVNYINVITCNYYYFLKLNFRFQPNACNDFHDLMQKHVSFNNVAIFLAKRIKK